MKNDYTETLTINNLKAQTVTHFRNAEQLFITKNAVSDFHDGDPDCYLLIAEDFRSGISIIDSLIVDDSFSDREAFDLVFGAIEIYRKFVSEEYKMTERRLSIFLADLNNYRANAYSY